MPVGRATALLRPPTGRAAQFAGSPPRRSTPVLLDVRLGPGDGISLAHELRQMQSDVRSHS